MRPLERRNMLFNKNTPEEDPQELKDAITKALNELAEHETYSPEYVKALEQIEKLYKLRNPKPELRKPVSMDTVWVVAGNLVGIGMIIGYEKAHVISSKALGFILKARV
jgi:hypothetical protein